MAESDAHFTLKRLAVEWALTEGYSALGLEVALPNSNFRADVAGCRMARPQSHELVIEQTIAFECKQSRADFLLDSFREDGQANRLKQLHQRKTKLEQLVGSHYPTLRQGDSLFPEYQSTDPREIKHAGYQKLIKEISRLQNGLAGRTKFDRLIRYRCVDLCYIVVRQGIVEPHEIADGWGILEVADLDGGRQDDKPPSIHLVKKPSWNDARPQHRLELLHRLARKSSYHLLEGLGISPGQDNNEEDLGGEEE